MVTELQGYNIPGLEAGEDLSTNQYRWVVQDATTKKVRRPDSATEIPLGILQNAPKSGDGATVCSDGVSKLVLGGAVAIGDPIGMEYVNAADAGKGVLVGAGNTWRGGRVIGIYGTAAEDELVSVLLDHPTPAKQTVTVALPVFTANSTIREFLMSVSRPMKITRFQLAAYTIPADADGNPTIQLINYDLSTTTEDELVAAFNAEGLVAKTPTTLTLITTAGINVLEAGDALFAVMVHNAAAIDTNWAAAGLTIEFEYL